MALKDANAWLDDKVMELHAKEKDVYAFHQWWHHLLRWGRKRTTGGRSFHGDDGEMATTLAEELEGWATYQEQKAKATDSNSAHLRKQHDMCHNNLPKTPRFPFTVIGTINQDVTSVTRRPCLANQVLAVKPFHHLSLYFTMRSQLRHNARYIPQAASNS